MALYEPKSLDEIEREFTDFRAWLGTDQLVHACLRTSVSGPGSILTGEDLMDLRDEIIKFTRLQAYERVN
jgi:hypothetical protein